MNTLFKHLKNDLPAGVVVFLVAMPLCLGIALASGAPLFSGVISGIVGGIVVASISGSSLGVSGPAAGLTVIVLGAIQDLGDYRAFLVAVVLAGIIQLILGMLKAGVIAYYFPSSVIKGMLTAIGIIIFLKQIPHAFGYDKDPEGDWGFNQMDGENTFSELYNMLEFISPGAVIISFLSLGILILWEQKFIKKRALFNIIQGPLVVVVLGIVLQLFFQDNGALFISKDHLVSIPVAEGFNDFVGLFTTPNFSYLSNPNIYVVALTLAIVASLETLLCVEATDKLDPEKRVTPTNKELFAQGAGNIVAGLIGGLPLTQVIVRSSANIQSGGKTKMSAIFHGFLLLISALAIPTIINLIPLASLAAILILVGYKLAKPSLFKEMYLKGRAEFIPFMVTVLGIVFTDLLIGICLGLVVGIFHILWNNYQMPYTAGVENPDDDKPIFKISLSENVTFLNKAGIMHSLHDIPDGSKVVLDMARTKSMHPDVLEIIENYMKHAEHADIEIETIGWDKLNQSTFSNPIREFQVKVKNFKR